MFSDQAKHVLWVAIGLLLLAGFGIYNHQLDEATDQGKQTATTKCVADTNAALLTSTQQALEDVQTQLLSSQLIVKGLREQKRQTEQQKEQLQKEIDYVTSTWIPPGKTTSEPVPACVFTRGFVRVYNQSISFAGAGAAGMSTALPAPRTDGAATTTTTAATSTDLHPSSVVQSDILQHVTRYGQHCQDTQAQLNKLIDYLETQGSRNANAG